MHHWTQEEFDLFELGRAPLSKASCGAIEVDTKHEIKEMGQPFIPDTSKKNAILVSPCLVIWCLVQEEKDALGLPLVISNQMKGSESCTWMAFGGHDGTRS